MRADIAAWFDSVEQPLAGVLVTLVDVTVLAKTRAVFCLTSQVVEVLSVKSFHDLFSASSHESCDDLANRSFNSKLPLKEAAATVWQIVSL